MAVSVSANSVKFIVVLLFFHHFLNKQTTKINHFFGYLLLVKTNFYGIINVLKELRKSFF